MKECSTHHFACGCREEKMKYIAERLLKEHHALQSALGADKCQCQACKYARELYGEME